MARWFLYAVLFCLSASPASACSPPRDEPSYSDRDVARLTRWQIRQADVIVDGLVKFDRNGAYYLRPIKVWRGQKRRRYHIANFSCGVALVPGEKVRALLDRDGPAFMMFSPVRTKRSSTRVADRIIDAHLGQRRPAEYQNGDGLRFAPPIKRPR